ncbi:MAG: family 20 glycosylhydrolase [Paludibacter sp.]|nr:family 20 glycosylhydrolase [Paludibacter sp.]
MNAFKLTTVLLLTLLISCFSFVSKAQVDFIIPKPVSVIKQKTEFIIDNNTQINLLENSRLMLQNGNYLSEQVNALSKKNIKTVVGKRKVNNTINISIDKKLGEEAYSLEVTNKQINLTGGSHKGVFYGIQTLLQVIPNEYLTKEPASKIIVPGVKIIDYPRLEYRGAMLDVGRHFYSVEEVKQFIDILALHKINTFHWHLTEDQGWRIEIKRYPELTQIGSVRQQTLVNHGKDKIKLYDGIPHGGFYTQDEIKSVVQHATDRFITVIPEIDMPGHMVAALATYPHLACDETKQYKVAEKWGVFHEVLCIGKETTFDFVQNVLLEVMELFPSKYIHIGGDECRPFFWKTCPHCQARMKKENLTKESDLQNYFNHRIEHFLQAHGREMIGWDEVLEGGVSQTATIMSWRGTKGGIEAAKKGNKVIMSPNSHCYFDKYQSKKTTAEPLAIGGYLPVSKVYDFDPLLGLNQEERKNIIGLQANLWTEYIKDFNHLQYMTLPRLAALAELGWTYGEKNEDEFIPRLKQFTKRYDALGYHYAKHIFTDLEGKFIQADSLTWVGKASDTKNIYHRIDTAAYHKMPQKVKSLFTNSAGIAIAFTTNSSSIAAKWSVKSGKGLPNVADINSMGLDLYIKKDGTWRYAGIGRPEGSYSEQIIATNMDTLKKECLLYLPTYDEITSLEIGVDKSSFIKPSATPFEGKYVIYGSSITQGASASRPGLAYPARMARATGLNFINLGLSGNGKMEAPVIQMLGDINCDAYIMDCISNPSPEEIMERAPFAIRYLREKHPETPIIFIQSVVREKGLFDEKVRLKCKQQNEAIERVFNDLQKEQIPHFYLIKENNFLGTDNEGTIDGVHPNDIGFDRMIKVIQPAILSILNKKDSALNKNPDN